MGRGLSRGTAAWWLEWSKRERCECAGVGSSVLSWSSISRRYLVYCRAIPIFRLILRYQFTLVAEPCAPATGFCHNFVQNIVRPHFGMPPSALETPVSEDAPVTSATQLPWSQIPKFVPGVTNVQEYAQMLKFLASLWPVEHLELLAPRVAL